MMRYSVHRVGPGQALGFGCVVGVILALLLSLGLVAAVLIVQSGQSETLRLLGLLGETLAPSLSVSWNVVGLAALELVVALGVFFALGAWLAALGFNLVARITGGLALDVTPDGASLPALPAAATPYSLPAQHDPTMPLPRPLQGAAPVVPFPVASSSAGAFAGAPLVTPQGGSGAPGSSPAQPADSTSQAVQPWLISEVDATALWALHIPTTTIGSDPSNDVVIAGDASVSPKHAEIRAESSGYVLYDLGTPTGTFVNDRRVQGRNLLKDGFRLKLGATGLLFRDLK